MQVKCVKLPPPHHYCLPNYRRAQYFLFWNWQQLWAAESNMNVIPRDTELEFLPGLYLDSSTAVLGSLLSTQHSMWAVFYFPLLLLYFCSFHHCKNLIISVFWKEEEEEVIRLDVPLTNNQQGDVAAETDVLNYRFRFRFVEPTTRKIQLTLAANKCSACVGTPSSWKTVGLVFQVMISWSWMNNYIW